MKGKVSYDSQQPHSYSRHLSQSQGSGAVRAVRVQPLRPVRLTPLLPSIAGLLARQFRTTGATRGSGKTSDTHDVRTGRHLFTASPATGHATRPVSGQPVTLPHARRSTAGTSTTTHGGNGCQPTGWHWRSASRATTRPTGHTTVASTFRGSASIVRGMWTTPTVSETCRGTRRSR